MVGSSSSTQFALEQIPCTLALGSCIGDRHSADFIFDVSAFPQDGETTHLFLETPGERISAEANKNAKWYQKSNDASHIAESKAFEEIKEEMPIR